MNVFQWMTLPLLAFAVIIEMSRFARDHRRLRLIRTTVWGIAAVLIAAPEFATSLARIVGIGRGTDLVFYLFMLATVGVLFHLYSQQFQMRQDFVHLVRQEALRNPRPGYGVTQSAVDANNLTDSFGDPSSSDSSDQNGRRHD